MKKSFFQAAFTFTELLISMAIIVLLSGLLLAEYQRGEYSRGLNDVAQRLAQDIRRVENMALEGEKYKGEISHGYGIGFKTTDKYFVFKDDDNGNDYDNGEEIETIDIPSDFKISSRTVITADGEEKSGFDKEWVEFTTSDFKTIITGRVSETDTSGSELKIEICWKARCKKNVRTVTVTNKGVVEIE